jgi:hypothetical protein
LSSPIGKSIVLSGNLVGPELLGSPPAEFHNELSFEP